MYSSEVIARRSIANMDDQELIQRWNAGMFSDDAKPIAQRELLKRGIDPLTQEIPDFSSTDRPLLKKLFSFEGRASRLQFWLVVPATWIAFIAISLLFEVLFERISYSLLLILIFGPLLPIAWLSWATFVQRLHDRNKSGNWIALLFVLPIIGHIWALIELGFFLGSPGPNKYGRR